MGDCSPSHYWCGTDLVFGHCLHTTGAGDSAVSRKRGKRWDVRHPFLKRHGHHSVRIWTCNGVDVPRCVEPLLERNKRTPHKAAIWYAGNGLLSPALSSRGGEGED